MAGEAIETIICANPVCKVAETRRCVEGLQLDVCPHYGREPEDGDQESDSVDAQAGAESLALPPAVTLTPAEASGVLRKGKCRVIAILGPSDAGKTSLIACLYDLFQEGSVAENEFAHSRTLHAFELTCHDARAASRRGVPHINRTPIGEVSFYHLEIGGVSTGRRLALLLGDRAGEEYREAANDVSVVATFPEVSRADTLTVLVDGERLLDAGARHNVRGDVVMLLQGLQDGDGLRAMPRLALVLTKLDVVTESHQGQRALRDFEALLADVRHLFGTRFEEVAPFQVAASPKTNAALRGTGVPDLLAFWLKPAAPPVAPVLTPSTLKRAFARLTRLDEPEEANNG
ncbi:TRAFAC clade GTPase domain-containing protein [Paraburkholderia rhizosphaerae]|uniref:Double-GTPase 2 domain-containing protein n=1 Tax=Paraburkholderia rhizosphaerae TaxID=480658 RepID=A0A4R8LRV7_9BURK|nr:hypothetical protein [Paraburkholderia rhizosphaerae]TDY48245.1 hypothetical protein BX592_111180 [Paraburkholderia rhizosphaerae]